MVRSPAFLIRGHGCSLSFNLIDRVHKGLDRHRKTPHFLVQVYHTCLTNGVQFIPDVPGKVFQKDGRTVSDVGTVGKPRLSPYGRTAAAVGRPADVRIFVNPDV